MAMQTPGDDLLGAVARGVQAGVFADYEANVILHTLLSEGGESTTSLLGNAVRLLAEDKVLQDYLRDRSTTAANSVDWVETGWSVIERILRNMFICLPGIFARILDFSMPLTGNLSFDPTDEFLDDPALPCYHFGRRSHREELASELCSCSIDRNTTTTANTRGREHASTGDQLRRRHQASVPGEGSQFDA